MVHQGASGGADGDNLRQTLALTLKRLETHQREYELLYYGLSSARIFFRPKDASGQNNRVLHFAKIIDLFATELRKFLNLF